MTTASSLKTKSSNPATPNSHRAFSMSVYSGTVPDTHTAALHSLPKSPEISLCLNKSKITFAYSLNLR